MPGAPTDKRHSGCHGMAPSNFTAHQDTLLAWCASVPPGSCVEPCRPGLRLQRQRHACLLAWEAPHKCGAQTRALDADRAGGVPAADQQEPHHRGHDRHSTWRQREAAHAGLPASLCVPPYLPWHALPCTTCARHCLWSHASLCSALCNSCAAATRYQPLTGCPAGAVFTSNTTQVKLDAQKLSTLDFERGWPSHQFDHGPPISKAEAEAFAKALAA